MHSLGRSTYAVRVSGFTALNHGLRDLLDRGALIASVIPANVTADATAFAAMGEAST